MFCLNMIAYVITKYVFGSIIYENIVYLNGITIEQLFFLNIEAGIICAFAWIYLFHQCNCIWNKVKKITHGWKQNNNRNK